MPKPVKFNGIIDGKKVKIIVKLKKGHKKQVFAKPNLKKEKKEEFNVDTVHFVKYHNVWSIHQDYSDEEFYREMQPQIIASGTFHAIKNYVRNSGLDIALLPTQETANGFTIDTNPSGVWVTFPSGVADQQYFWGLGKWSEWKKKR